MSDKLFEYKWLLNHMLNIKKELLHNNIMEVSLRVGEVQKFVQSQLEAYEETDEGWVKYMEQNFQRFVDHIAGAKRLKEACDDYNKPKRCLKDPQEGTKVERSECKVTAGKGIRIERYPETIIDFDTLYKIYIDDRVYEVEGNSSDFDEDNTLRIYFDGEQTALKALFRDTDGYEIILIEEDEDD